MTSAWSSALKLELVEFRKRFLAIVAVEASQRGGNNTAIPEIVASRR
jgi:hypothetical protein